MAAHLSRRQFLNIACAGTSAFLLPGLSSCSKRFPVRALTYNIHHAEGTDGLFSPQRIIEIIRTENPDVVFLQEVDRNVLRTGGRDLASDFGEALKMHFAFGKNLDFQGGGYGNAILTKSPIISKTNHHFANLDGGEQRGALEVRTLLGDQEVVLISTHLDHRPNDLQRLASVEFLAALNKKIKNLPSLIAGDFNASPGSEVYKRLTREWVDVWVKAGKGNGFTIAADRPYERIDFIFASKHFRPRQARVLQTLASDHLPLVADLDCQ